MENALSFLLLLLALYASVNVICFICVDIERIRRWLKQRRSDTDT